MSCENSQNARRWLTRVAFFVVVPACVLLTRTSLLASGPGRSTDHDGGAPACEKEAARLAKLLEEDELFDAVPREAEPRCAPNVVRFRFTGTGAYGIPPSQVGRISRRLDLHESFW